VSLARRSTIKSNTHQALCLTWVNMQGTPVTFVPAVGVLYGLVALVALCLSYATPSGPVAGMEWLLTVACAFSSVLPSSHDAFFLLSLPFPPPRGRNGSASSHLAATQLSSPPMF
jgi:hypothetical protein